MVFLCYERCTTCKRAKAWLIDRGIAFTERPIKEENPSLEELRQWYQRSGLPLKKFFNTSGLLYKSMELKDKLPTMTEEEQLQLLATDGMLVKRPMLIMEDTVLVGFRENEWAEVLGLWDCPTFGCDDKYYLIGDCFLKKFSNALEIVA